MSTESAEPQRLTHPYRQIVRPGPEGHYTRSGCSAYIGDERYADEPRAFVRTYLLLEKDLHELFEFIEPADSNQAAYSMRTQILLTRACIEVEANAKSILAANKFDSIKQKDWTMRNAYFRLQASHHLAAYRVRIPDWRGAAQVRQPFKAWSGDEYAPLPWYRGYNRAKHDRAGALHEASFERLVDAVCGCLVLITAQFLNEDFSGASGMLLLDGPSDGFEESVSEYHLRVQPPDDFPEEEWYGFEGNAWRKLREEPDPFRRYDYDTVAGG